MSVAQLAPEGYLEEIIKLQLKKPKHWKWQLSTSKSSPQIALPIIQLYDSKGKLLLEAKDSGATQRRSWHSSDIRPKETTANAKKEYKESSARRLQRCRSDTLDCGTRKNTPLNKFSSIKQQVSERSLANRLNKFYTTTLDNSISKKSADVFNTNREFKDLGGNAIRIDNFDLQRNLYALKKSKSDFLELKGASQQSVSSRQNSLRPIRSEVNCSESKEKQEPRRHRRSRSDDLFRRKLKYNEESIKRAETDGYRNFLTPNVTPDKDDGAPAKGNVRSAATAENVLLLNNGANIEVNHFKHNRYKTRTSSAGTLIISEESFNNCHRRRRRRDASIENGSYAQNNAGQKDTVDNGRGTNMHVRQVSDPTSLKTGPALHQTAQLENRFLPGIERRRDAKQLAEKGLRSSEKIGKKLSRSTIPGLFYSHSDIFPLEKTLRDDKPSKNRKVECNYTARETVPSGSDNKSVPIIEKLDIKKRRKVRRRYSDASTSSSTLEKKCNRNKRKGTHTKARVVQEQPKDAVGSGDSDLLQLVRRLSSNDHVKMGANVSRHSSKGLSGRRSQSSGSICNGKGKHNDGKMCGSLPSYLDDRNSTGCNNNHHDCEKPPLDEVQRIPPLGDGAPLHWKFSDNQTVLCDQGYGSERSPEEEYPPPLPDHDSQCHHHLEPHACYPFITPESTFVVKLTKSSRGLGLSVTGGIDSGGSWPGLIRIKRLFPHQPASACGLLNVGDLIIEANGITLTGLTNYEALEVLRTAPNQVDLKVCRPPPDVLSCVSPISEVPPPPPRREPPTSLNLPSAVYSTPEDDYYHGEFEVKLTKIQGSLGFTLRKEDDSALGHYVRALVREPALTDGRIRAGDKIIAVNDVEISPMTHEQAVQFLRQCGDVVKLRLYRDSAQTPVAALSPTETTPRTSFSKKTHLRQEAVDMLNDIAVRKLIPGSQETYRRSTSPTASPRKLKRQPCPSDASQNTDSSMKYMINDEQFHEGLLQKCPYPYDDENFNLFSIESDDGDRPSRPSSLDLYNPNQTPVATRKPRFNFSLAHNAYELNNLDPEVLDAPNLTYNLGADDVNSTDAECGDSFPKEPASMPHIPTDNPGFSYKNPAYQSAHPQCGVENEEKPASSKTNKTDDTNMKKWKGVVFDGNEDTGHNKKMPMQEEYEILAIELNRGWNSRLGFSLQGAAGVTYVSAVHADSVAAKDGRLKPGDRVIKVNDESVENMSTNEIIDLLRIVRGPVCIVVSRIKSKEDCPKSNAEN